VGSGGRIAIYYTTLTNFTINSTYVQAFTGDSTMTGNKLYYGGAGTVFHKSTSDTNGHLIYNSGGRSSRVDSLMLPDDHLDLTLDSLTIESNAKRYHLSTSPTITVENVTIQTSGVCKIEDNSGEADFGSWFVPTSFTTGTCSEVAY